LTESIKKAGDKVAEKADEADKASTDAKNENKAGAAKIEAAAKAAADKAKDAIDAAAEKTNNAIDGAVKAADKASDKAADTASKVDATVDKVKKEHSKPAKKSHHKEKKPVDSDSDWEKSLSGVKLYLRTFIIKKLN